MRVLLYIDKQNEQGAMHYMIMNISGLVYSVKDTFFKMEKVLDESSIDDDLTGSNDNNNELFNAIGTCLHWIMDCLDRIDSEFNYDDKETKVVSAFRGANNLLKHNVNIIHLHKVEGGFTFPISFPLIIPAKHYVWLKVNEDELQNRYLNQTRNYNELLGDKDIKETMQIAIDIINKYFDMVK